MHRLSTKIIFTLLFCLVHTIEDVVIGSNVFHEVVYSKAYVDKTLLLKHIFDDKVMLITAPRRFLKSTNLHMVKVFLQVPVDKFTGNLIMEKEGTANYKLFTNTAIYKEERSFFDENFGNHPVLHLDLKPHRPVISYREALKVLSFSVHSSFREHRYLCINAKLTAREKKLCRNWCDLGSYRMLSQDDLLDGLSNLATLLYDHYGSKVYVLVDEYDAMIADLMFDVEEKEMKRTVNLIVSQVSGLLKENACVIGGIVTGKTQIVGSGASQLNHFKVFRFLDRHKLAGFYGFTETEVDDLFELRGFDLSTETITKAKERYNGYTRPLGKTIYSPYSVINFLESGVVDNYWIAAGGVHQLNVVFKDDYIKSMVDKLLLNDSISIEMQRHLDLQDIVGLRDMFNTTNSGHVKDSSVLFTHLFQLGYLSYDVQSNTYGTKRLIKIPNEEVYSYFLEMMKRFYVNEYNIERDWLNRINRGNFSWWFDRVSGFAKTGGPEV